MAQRIAQSHSGSSISENQPKQPACPVAVPVWMRCRLAARALSIALLVMGVVGEASAKDATAPTKGTSSPAEIERQRREMLNAILTSDPASVVATQRRLCASGDEPARVASDRAEGAAFMPDAADVCVTALVRKARDRQLPELYRQLLVELTGTERGYETLPRAIGAASQSGGSGKVTLGNQKAATVTPALAFDAGFTVAYLEGAAANTGAVDAAGLKTISESCLGQKAKLTVCFSAGYMHGAQAVTMGKAAR